MLRAAIALSLLAAAAEPPVVIRGGVDVVQIDAVVTDGKDRHVTDLKAEDFEILEDGRPRQVTHCEYVVTELPAAESPAAAPPRTFATALKREDVTRSMAIVVDDLTLAFEDVHTVRDGLGKLIDDLRPSDLVAVVRTSGGMGILQQFTTDKEVLRAAVSQVRFNGMSLAGSTPGESAAAIKVGAEAEAAGVLQRVPSLDAMTRSIEGMRHQALARGALASLEYVIDGLSRLPGRKSVMFVSSTLSVRDYFEAGEGEPSAGREVSDEMVERLRSIAKRANLASVVLYTMDPRGLKVTWGGADTMAWMRNRQESQAGLIALAEETGGLFVPSGNDVGWAARKIVADQQGYYLLGYTTEGSEGRLHRVKVSVKRRGLTVRARAAYQGSLEADSPAPAGATDEMLSAAISPFAPSELPVRLTPVVLRDAKDGYLVRSFLHIDGKSITFETPAAGERPTARLIVMTAAFGDNGIVVDQIAEELPLRVPAEHLEPLKRAGLMVDIDLPVRKAGIYQIRAVVRDAATGRQGSARHFLPVAPRRKGRLALSGIILTGVRHDAGRPTDAAPEATHAVRRFRPGSDLIFGVMVYEGRSADPAVPAVETTARLYRDQHLLASEKVDTTVAPAAPPRRNKKGQMLPEPAGQSLLGSLHLSSKVEPGDYVLEISAVDPRGKAPHNVATQRVDFEVVAPPAAP